MRLASLLLAYAILTTIVGSDATVSARLPKICKQCHTACVDGIESCAAADPRLASCPSRRQAFCLKRARRDCKRNMRRCCTAYCRQTASIVCCGSATSSVFPGVTTTSVTETSSTETVTTTTRPASCIVGDGASCPADQCCDPETHQCCTPRRIASDPACYFTASGCCGGGALEPNFCNGPGPSVCPAGTGACTSNQLYTCWTCDGKTMEWSCTTTSCASCSGAGCDSP